MGALVQKEISQMIEKESNIIGQIKEVIENHNYEKILDFVGVDEFLEEKNQTHSWLINCR